MINASKPFSLAVMNVNGLNLPTKDVDELAEDTTILWSPENSQARKYILKESDPGNKTTEQMQSITPKVTLWPPHTPCTGKHVYLQHNTLIFIIKDTLTFSFLF